MNSKTEDCQVVEDLNIPEVSEHAGETFAAQVWNRMARYDIMDHLGTIPEWTNPKTGKKRPAVNYLPWEKAWLLIKRQFPATTYAHLDDIIHGDGTMEVQVLVTVRESDTNTGPSHAGTPHFERVETRTVQCFARLAVMDSSFNAIQNPHARQINDSRQRALVKALAYGTGLGLNLWADTMIPVGKLADPINEKQLKKLRELIEAAQVDEEKVCEWLDVDVLSECPRERYNSALTLLEDRVKAKSAEKA